MTSSNLAAGVPPVDPTTSLASDTEETREVGEAVVTGRAWVVGCLLTTVIAWLNCWLSTVERVHMVGGIQMPFGAIFVLLLLVLFVNLPCRAAIRFVPRLRKVFPPFSPTELLVVYAMLIIGSLISSPGCDNLFLMAGPTLFYFSTKENGWASLFYKFVPSWFSAGWDGATYQREFMNALYQGGSGFAHIPWHAWAVPLTAWSIFLLLTYAVLFFVALLFRRQWTINEALAFPLLELPLLMSQDDEGKAAGPHFWRDNMMWMGFAIAFMIHFLNGMHSHYPDWPVAPVNAFGSVTIVSSERPWNAMPPLHAEIFLGGIGLAYLLTREVAFSFWFFFLVMGAEYVMAEMVGVPAVGLPKTGIMGRPDFIIYQSVGAWLMIAVLLAWLAREHLGQLARQAFSTNISSHDELFTPRFVVFGFLLSCAGLLLWSLFAGINLAMAMVFFGIFVLTSLVLTRLVIEGGFMFPQAPYYPLQWMTDGMFGASVVGAASLTKLSFIQPMLLVDMRTNLLPAFMHTLKIAEMLQLDRRQQRRLLGAVLCAVPLTLAVTVVVSLLALYTKGGLAVYTWFSIDAAKSTFEASAQAIKTQAPVHPPNFMWMALGAAVVWLLVLGRSRYTWFMLHPLGYLVAPAYPITRLWFSFFVSWLIKSLVLRYGGSSAYVRLRPFMMGLVLGNATAMMLWTGIAVLSGHQIKYWPA